MIIAHDLGTTGNKASLHDRTGRLLRAVTVNYPTRYGSGGVAEQNPQDWLDAVVAATRKLLSQSGIQGEAADRGEVEPRDIAAIVLSGQMMGSVLLDKDYRPVRPAMIWADSRSVKQTERLLTRIAQPRAYRLLGHRLNPTYSLEKAMWVAEREPEVFDRVRHFCVAKDFVVQRLTGMLVTDRSDASGTNAWDQINGAWSDELIDAAGLPRTLFGDVLESTTVLGPLTSLAAEELGLSTDVQVVLGGGDGPIAAVGAGITSPESGAYVYLGSSSWISLAHPSPIWDRRLRTMTFDHVVPGLYAPTATVVAGAGSVEWLCEVIEPLATPGRAARVLEGVADVEAASDGLFFLPHLLGERSPHWNPAAAGAFVGLSRQHQRPHLARAVLEGVAFNLATCLGAFREAGTTITRIDAIGGGAASSTWLQILADVWGVKIRRRSIVEEANSLGAAVTAAVGLGWIDFSAAGELSEVTAEFEPDPSRTADYADRHRIFQDAYVALEPWFATRTDVSAPRRTSW